MALKKIIINQQCVFTTLSSILRIVHFRVELSYPCLWYKATKGGNQSDETAKEPVSQLVWHDKDPSLLKGHEGKTKGNTPALPHRQMVKTPKKMLNNIQSIKIFQLYHKTYIDEIPQ